MPWIEPASVVYKTSALSTVLFLQTLLLVLKYLCQNLVVFLQSVQPDFVLTVWKGPQLQNGPGSLGHMDLKSVSTYNSEPIRFSKSKRNWEEILGRWSGKPQEFLDLDKNCTGRT